MVVTLDYLIKKIRLNGGKTAPLAADALDKINTELKLLRAQIEGATSHEVFWEAVNECREAGEELSTVRHATGFVTKEQLEEATTFKPMDWALYIGIPTIAGLIAGYVGAKLGGV